MKRLTQLSGFEPNTGEGERNSAVRERNPSPLTPLRNLALIPQPLLPSGEGEKNTARGRVFAIGNAQDGKGGRTFAGSRQ